LAYEVGHVLGQAAAGNQFHDIVGPPLVLADGVERDDVLVLSRATGFRMAVLFI
jgi:hypothetical protein